MDILLAALSEWQDKIGKKRTGSFKNYEKSLWEAIELYNYYRFGK